MISRFSRTGPTQGHGRATEAQRTGAMHSMVNRNEVEIRAFFLSDTSVLIIIHKISLYYYKYIEVK
jgi:hypothetical protein